MFSINCNGRLLMLTEPLVMGIINTTPDSFYPDSRHQEIQKVVQTAEKMIGAGAALIDIGGQSTRPGSHRLSAAEEYDRVIPAVEALHQKFPSTPISVDTFYATVAEAAVQRGASIINDVSAGSIDPDLLPTVARLGVPYVLMHMQGDPQTMQQNPYYDNVVANVFDFFTATIDAVQKRGIKDIIVDPGFGFGKTAAHNFTLLKHLSFFKQLEKPLLVGISRKGTVYKTLGITADEALNGTTVLNTVALLQGARILRVHDVTEAVQAVKLVAAVSGDWSK